MVGVQQLKDFLDPECRNFPIVELPDELNPYRKQGIHIYAYLLFMNPLLQVKALPSYYLVQDVIKDSNITKLVESSSGNTAIGLTVFGRVFGNCKTTALVSSQVLPGKLSLLEILATEITMHDEPICPNPRDPESGINKAKELAQQPGYANPGQYDNPINWQSHYRISGPKLYEKLPFITDFIASLGTTGTFFGISKFLKEQKGNIVCTGVVRKENNPIPGPRTLGLLKHIAFDWQSMCDNVYDCSSYNAYTYSKKLCEYGILGGPSSGMQYRSALEKAKQYSNGLIQERHIAFVCCDTMLPYALEYGKILKQDVSSNIHDKLDTISCEELSQYIREKHTIEIIDLRPHEQYNEYHIPGSFNICFHHIDQFIETLQDRSKKYIFVCQFGAKSEIIAKYLFSLGFDAYSLQKGILDWYTSGFEVRKHKQCILRKTGV